MSADYLSERWSDLVRDEVFVNARADDRPLLILLGGQPGAGKTRAGDEMARHADHQVTRLIGDDYRQFHPDYPAVLAREPLAMPDVTAQAAGEWLRLAVDHAIENRYSILIEGTWRNAEVPLKTIELAAAHGYEVHAVAVGVQPEVSRLSTLERYYRDVDQGEQARWTPGAAHEEAVAAIGDTAERLGASPHVEACAVVTRDGEQTFVDGCINSSYPGEVRGLALKGALLEQMEAPLPPDQAQVWLRQCGELHAAHERHTLDHPDAQQVWQRILEHDHPRVVRAAGDAGEAAGLGGVGEVSAAPSASPTRGARGRSPGISPASSTAPRGTHSKYAPGGPHAPGAGLPRQSPPGFTR